MKIASYKPDSTSLFKREYEQHFEKINVELNLSVDRNLQEFTKRILKGFWTFLLMTDDQNQSILNLTVTSYQHL